MKEELSLKIPPSGLKPFRGKKLWSRSRQRSEIKRSRVVVEDPIALVGKKHDTPLPGAPTVESIIRKYEKGVAHMI